MVADTFFVAVGGSIVVVAVVVGFDVGDANDFGGMLGTRRSTMAVGVIVGATVT